MRLRLALSCLLLAGCEVPAERAAGDQGEGAEELADDRAGSEVGGAPSPAETPRGETQADAARRVAEDAQRQGAPGVTEPVFDPRMADQQGQTWQTRAELEASRTRDNPPAK